MPQDIQVRLADRGDADTIVKFNVAMALETEHKELLLPVVTRGVRALFENPQHGFYLVAETADEVVGCLMITYEWSDWRCGVFWWLQSVYVKPEFRRRGVFRKLYEFLRVRAAQGAEVCGFRLCFEQSNQAAQTTYGKIGMTKTSYGVFEQEFRQ
jgi:ribosomal protein S18 acetylase RimI-like enzyme